MSLKTKTTNAIIWLLLILLLASITNAVDTTNPSVFAIIPAQGTIFEGQQTIIIGANITDDVNVSSAFINITFPNSTIYILTLLNTSAPEHYVASFSLPNLTGIYSVQFVANDTSNNINDTGRTDFVLEIISSDVYYAFLGSLIILFGVAFVLVSISRMEYWDVLVDLSSGQSRSAGVALFSPVSTFFLLAGLLVLAEAVGFVHQVMLFYVTGTSAFGVATETVSLIMLWILYIVCFGLLIMFIIKTWNIFQLLNKYLSQQNKMPYDREQT